MTIRTDADRRLRVEAARRDMSVGALISELAEMHLPPVHVGKAK